MQECNPPESIGYIAAKSGHYQIVQFLSEQVPEKNPTKVDGSTFGHCAAKNGHVAVVEFCRYEFWICLDNDIGKLS